MRAAVVIPIYKDELTCYEVLSLKQCFKVLSKYPIIFVAPHSINLNAYWPFCGDNCQIVYFEKKYFQNIAGYNRLMLLPDFYKRFLNYKFILIYQLDAFVFKDDLEYWCKQNYDYIGAPHIPHANLPGQMQYLKNYTKLLKLAGKVFGLKHAISNVGNGGFSLRKTKSCYWLLQLLNRKAKEWGDKNEDGFFKYWGNIFYPIFSLPKDEEALKFSIEISPGESLKKLNNVLPFGCHAYEKYEWKTWAPFIINE